MKFAPDSLFSERMKTRSKYNHPLVVDDDDDDDDDDNDDNDDDDDDDGGGSGGDGGGDYDAQLFCRCMKIVAK